GSGGERRAEERKHEDCDGHDSEASRQGLSCPARAAEACVDEGDAGKGERGNQQQKQGKQRRGFAQGRRRGEGHARFFPHPFLFWASRSRAARSWAARWPRAATTRPRTSMAIAQRMK